jgi:hypothetical protein
MSVAEMKMLRWMNEVIRKDRIRNEHVRSSIDVTSIVDKMSENNLRWFVSRRCSKSRRVVV